MHLDVAAGAHLEAMVSPWLECAAVLIVLPTSLAILPEGLFLLGVFACVVYDAVFVKLIHRLLSLLYYITQDNGSKLQILSIMYTI